MLKKMTFFICGLFFGIQTVYAALPPLAQNIAELKKMISREEINKLGVAEIIEYIKKTDSGYDIKTTNKKMNVAVMYSSRGVGPVKFDLIFGEPMTTFTTPQEKHNTKQRKREIVALPPLAQNISELKAVISDDGMNKLGMAEIIEYIRKTDSGYTIETTNKKMNVDVIYSSKEIGPVKFDLQFSEPTARMTTPEVKNKTK